MPRGVFRERVTCGGHPGGVQLDQFDGDVAHRFARLALGRGPITTTHFAERRSFSPDVAGEQVKLIGGNEQLVVGQPAFIGRVLDDQKLAPGLDRVAPTRGDLALHQLNKPADAVGLVNHVVTGLELQGVDDVLAAGGHFLDLARVVASASAIKLSFADDGKLDFGEFETVLDGGLQNEGDPGLRVRRKSVGDAPGQLVLGQNVDRALHQTVALRNDGNTPPGTKKFPDVANSALNLAGETGHRGGLNAHVEVAVDDLGGAGLKLLASRFSNHLCR